MVGWVGDPIKNLELHLFADAGFAGCSATQRSTSGLHLRMQGAHACFPLGGVSKRQSCVSHSAPEAEMAAADFTLRHSGLPAMVVWDVVLQVCTKSTSAVRGTGATSPSASADTGADEGPPIPVSYTHLTLPTNREV